MKLKLWTDRSRNSGPIKKQYPKVKGPLPRRWLPSTCSTHSPPGMPTFSDPMRSSRAPVVISKPKAYPRSPSPFGTSIRPASSFSPVDFQVWTVAYCDQQRSVFTDITKALVQALKTMGYIVDHTIGNAPSPRSGRVIAIGTNLINRINVPADAIVYQLEQPGSRWMNEKYLSILRKHVVWDFTQHGVNYLRKLGCPRVYLCRVGSTDIKPRSPVRKDIDVLFYGSPHPRREAILSQLKRNGVNVHDSGAWGAQREHLISRAKIFLNIHYYPTAVMEMVRLAPVLSQGAFIVSEKGADADMEKRFADGVVFAPHGQLVDAVMSWLRKPQADRDRVAAKASIAWKAMSLKSELERCINESVPELSQRPIKCFITNFNRLTWVRNIVAQIRRLGGEPIILDNASTYPPLLNWYNSGCDCRVVRLPKNFGSRAAWLSGVLEKEVKRGECYVVTDPDLDLSRVPANALRLLRQGLLKYGVRKAGLSLEIKDVPRKLLDVKQHNNLTLEQIESKYWTKKLDPNFYKANVDTTFAMYLYTGKVVQDDATFYSGIRSDRPYTARHLPWYRTEADFDEEDDYYVKHRISSRVGRVVTNGSWYDAVRGK